MRTPILLIAPLLLLGGCGSDPIECGAPADITGTWTYSGIQSAPPPGATLSGTMSLSTSGTCTFDGHLSVTVDDGSGPPAMLDGGVSGLFLNDSTVDLTANLGGERRHLGTVRADTIVGTFSVAASGTFRAVRGAP